MPGGRAAAGSFLVLELSAIDADAGGPGIRVHRSRSAASQKCGGLFFGTFTVVVADDEFPALSRQVTVMV